MPVIAFANSKGGSGKTTSALLLACALAEKTPTTIIDADPRHPIQAWAEKEGKPELLSVVVNDSEKNIIDQIEEAATKDSFVIIDLEGVGSVKVNYAIGQSDLVIIPLKEQQQDAQAALDVIEQIHLKMRDQRRKIPYSLLFTQTKAAVKSRTERHIAEQFRNNEHVDVFQSEIVQRDAYAAMYATGGWAANLDPKNVNGLAKALENAEGFRDEVIAKLRDLREQPGKQEVA